MWNTCYWRIHQWCKVAISPGCVSANVNAGHNDIMMELARQQKRYKIYPMSAYSNIVFVVCRELLVFRRPYLRCNDKLSIMLQYCVMMQRQLTFDRLIINTLSPFYLRTNTWNVVSHYFRFPATRTIITAVIAILFLL